MIKTGCWKNQRAFVVGGGSSLEGFNFEDLRGENLIVVNARLFDIPWAPVFFSMDHRFYKWVHNGSLDKWQPGHNFKKLWDDFEGERLYMQTEPGKLNKTFGDDVRVINCVGIDGLSFDLEKGLCSGGNSGLAGLYLAVALGANPIYLLGIDMYTTETKSHSYKCKYPTSQINQKMDNYIKRFNIAAPLLEKRGIKVINVNDSRRSGLQCFPFGELQLSGDCGFVVVSYYTKNTEYQNDAIRLIESLDRHGVAHEI